jgi:branched-subunit amino acid aminotransferase/4-amino-4-deoxychorismate lyase
MLAVARASAREAGAANAEFVKGMKVRTRPMASPSAINGITQAGIRSRRSGRS